MKSGLEIKPLGRAALAVLIGIAIYFLFYRKNQNLIKKTSKGKSAMEFVTVKELSKFLKVKESTLYSWVHNGSIPYHKLNGLVRFDMKEILQWINNSKPLSHSPTAPSRESKHLDIDRVVKNAIDTAVGKEYNSSNGKPGQIKVSGRRFNGTV